MCGKEFIVGQDRVQGVLSDASIKNIEAAVATIRNELPFLIDLSADDRHSLLKMGDKSVAFVQAAERLAKRSPEILPRTFDVEEMARDVALVMQLRDIQETVGQLLEGINDTVMGVGSDAYVAALTVYNNARTNGQGAMLDDLLDAMGQRFARKASGIATPQN